MGKKNYHAHTPRCFHAQGTEREMTEAAIRAGYDTLGFSDHGPWKYGSDYVATMRMPVSQLDDYVSAVRNVQAEYADKIKVYLGFEYEYFPQYMGWLKDMLAEKHIDYIIMGNHFDGSDENGIYFGAIQTEKEAAHYADMVVRGLKTGMYTYLAHPDIFLRSIQKMTPGLRSISRDLCQAVRDMGIPMEYNLEGVRAGKRGRHAGMGYPTANFWPIAAEAGCDVILGVDAHQPSDMEDAATYDEATEYLRSLGMHILDGVEIPSGR